MIIRIILLLIIILLGLELMFSQGWIIVGGLIFISGIVCAVHVFKNSIM